MVCGPATSSGNHIAQRVTQIVREPCLARTGYEGNEACENGRCVPVIK